MPIFPAALKTGDTIALVAPSRWPEPLWLKKAEKALTKMGFTVVIHPQCYEQWGRLAGTDYARAAALTEVFLDPSIKAVMAARGGTGANRILDLLDYDLLAEHPKPFIGFSDATALLQALARQANMVTFHGPMGWNFASPRAAENDADFLAVLMGKKKITLDFAKVEGVRTGTAAGVLWGGNMSLLQSLIGTPYDWAGKDVILFLEDVEEPLYKIDRMMQQLRQTGKLKHVRAVIVGEMVGMIDADDRDPTPYGQSVAEIMAAAVPASLPLVMNFPCGHGRRMTTLPVGAEVSFAIDPHSARLEVVRR